MTEWLCLFSALVGMTGMIALLDDPRAEYVPLFMLSAFIAIFSLVLFMVIITA